MAKLKAKARNALPSSDFAGPDRSYPIEDASHARNAKARVANKSPALKARVDAKVKAKYGFAKGTSKVPGKPLGGKTIDSMKKSLQF